MSYGRRKSMPENLTNTWSMITCFRDCKNVYDVYFYERDYNGYYENNIRKRRKDFKLKEILKRIFFEFNLNEVDIKVYEKNINKFLKGGDSCP
jgi:hypothetical protein